MPAGRQTDNPLFCRVCRHTGTVRIGRESVPAERHSPRKWLCRYAGTVPRCAAKLRFPESGLTRRSRANPGDGPTSAAIVDWRGLSVRSGDGPGSCPAACRRPADRAGPKPAAVHEFRRPRAPDPVCRHTGRPAHSIRGRMRPIPCPIRVTTRVRRHAGIPDRSLPAYRHVRLRAISGPFSRHFGPLGSMPACLPQCAGMPAELPLYGVIPARYA
jgi:hypothetical protein